METISAQILIGTGAIGTGITPKWTCSLVEGARPHWILRNLEDSNSKPFVWFTNCTERILEDGLVMIGYHCYQEGGIRNQVESTITDAAAQEVDLSTAAYQVDLEVLCDLIRKIKEGKLTLSVFERSVVLDQIAILDEYKFNIELLLPVYTRFFNGSSKLHEDRGELVVPEL